MFRPIYEGAAALFLLQGVAIPVLVVAAGFQFFRQTARSAAVGKALADDKARRGRTWNEMLKAVPKLAPLSCAGCGAPVALEAEHATCTGCRSAAALPEDYRATIALRRQLPRLAAAAVRYWWAARLLTFAPTRWLFRLMVIGEPALFVVVLIGAATYPDTFLDRLLEDIGEGWSFVLGLLAFGGFILWMITFLLLGMFAKDLGDKLTDLPVRRRQVGGGASEYSTCRSCGGGVHFARGRLVCLCGYCTMPNYRAEAARAERAERQDEQVHTRSELFTAMEAVEGMIGAFFITMGILFVGFLGLVGWTALTAE